MSSNAITPTTVSFVDSSQQEQPESIKKYYVTNYGGAGHIETVKREILREQKLAQDKGYEFAHKTFNILDILGKPLGKIAANVWNKGQRTGNTKKQDFFVRAQIVQEIVLMPLTMVRIFIKIWRFKPDQIVSCQHLSPKAIILAARLANLCFKKYRANPLLVEVVLTDLPSDRCKSFFRPMKWLLNSRDKRILRVRAPGIAPFSYRVAQKMRKMEENQGIAYSREERQALIKDLENRYWMKYAGLTLYDPNNDVKNPGNVTYGDLPVREAFQHQSNAEDVRPDTFQVRINNPGELQFINDHYHQNNPLTVYQNSDYNGDHSVIDFNVNSDDIVIFETLGSQTPPRLLQEDLATVIAAAQEELQRSHDESAPARQIKYFITCGKHNEGDTKSVLAQVQKLIQEHPQWPDNLQVIPMSYQDDTQIAPMFEWADILIPRTGGFTCFELLSKRKGSEANPSQKILLRGVATGPTDSDPLSDEYQQLLWSKGFHSFEKGNAADTATLLNYDEDYLPLAQQRVYYADTKVLETILHEKIQKGDSVP